MEQINYTIDERGYFKYDTFKDFVLKVNDAMEHRHAYGSNNTECFWFNIFMPIYGNAPCVITDNDEECDYLDIEKDKEEKDEDAFMFAYENMPKPEKKKSSKVNIKASMLNMMELYKNRHLLYRENSIVILVTEDFVAIETYEGNILFYSKTPELSEDVRNAISVTNINKNSLYKYVIKTHYGFDTDSLEVKHNDIDLSLLYNDDLPHKQIMEFLGSKDAGLIVLHGEPGTGKSSYIRYLIEQFPDEKFMILDSSVFEYITDSSFIKLLMDNANSAIILEDCENMVSERIGNKNIATLLNLTDGIIGDSFNLKFICTFNTEIHNIDPALLRKGRLKMKYEFKKLAVDKIKNIAKEKEFNITNACEMTLADIMNYNVNNGSESTKKNGIGFKSSK